MKLLRPQNLFHATKARVALTGILLIPTSLIYLLLHIRASKTIPCRKLLSSYSQKQPLSTEREKQIRCQHHCSFAFRRTEEGASVNVNRSCHREMFPCDMVSLDLFVALRAVSGTGIPLYRNIREARFFLPTPNVKLFNFEPPDRRGGIVMECPP